MPEYKDFIPEGEPTGAQTDHGYSDFVDTPEPVKHEPEAPKDDIPQEPAAPAESVAPVTEPPVEPAPGEDTPPPTKAASTKGGK